MSMRLPLREHPVLSLLALLLVLLLTWGFWPQAVQVEATPVTRGPLSVTIEEEGRTRLRDRYVVSAPVDGVACRVDLEVGNPVEQGQLLLQIAPLDSQVLDPRSRAQAEAKVAAASSALRAAEEQASAAAASQQLAASELARLKPLLDKALISRDIYDRAAAEAKTSAASRRSADYRVEVARSELEAARTALQYSAAAETGEPAEQVPVRSPITGRILKIAHECEGPVRTGDPLLEIGDPRVLEVEVDVLSPDAVRIHPGMPVLFDRWGGPQPLEAVVRTIEPVGFTKISALGVEEQRVLVICDFTSPPEQWQRLGDGYRVEARFLIWQQDDVLQVPASSLFRYRDGWALFAVEDGRAVRRSVQVGQRNGLVAQILEGVGEGEQVINHPSDEVDHGRRVRLR